MNDFFNTCLYIFLSKKTCLHVFLSKKCLLVYFSKSTPPKKSGLWKSGLGRSMG